MATLTRIINALSAQFPTFFEVYQDDPSQYYVKDGYVRAGYVKRTA